MANEYPNNRSRSFESRNTYDRLIDIPDLVNHIYHPIIHTCADGYRCGNSGITVDTRRSSFNDSSDCEYQCFTIHGITGESTTSVYESE